MTRRPVAVAVLLLSLSAAACAIDDAHLLGELFRRAAGSSTGS